MIGWLKRIFCRSIPRAIATARAESARSESLLLAREIALYVLQDGQLWNELIEDGYTELECLLAVSQIVSTRHHTLCSFLSDRVGLRVDWGAIHDELYLARSGESTFALRNSQTPMLSCVVHHTLLPELEKLRACAPGRSDAAVAVALELARRRGE